MASKIDNLKSKIQAMVKYLDASDARIEDRFSSEFHRLKFTKDESEIISNHIIQMDLDDFARSHGMWLNFLLDEDIPHCIFNFM